MTISKNVIYFFILLHIFGCEKVDDISILIPTPSHFPKIEYPPSNLPSKKKLAFGKLLFFDTRLSLDSTLSCASCHLPEYAFSDTTAVSIGVGGSLGKRNAPTLLNVAYEKLFNKDGGVTKLDIFALVPIEDHNEMGISILELSKRLSKDVTLQKTANEIYGRNIDAFVISRSLSSYVRSLISAESKYDSFYVNQITLSEIEERGRKLFFSPSVNCSSCHSGILFTNQAFENNGTKETYLDQGRKLVTGKAEDWGKFKVPSLRNVKMTAPYMHDGSFNTLQQVIAHYNNGGKNHVNKNSLIKPLNLSDQDQRDLLAFLHTLTDKKYIEY